jgi:hypothetical protein
MPKQYVIDCRKFPSDKMCDLNISGSDEEAVIDTAYNHAIEPMHNHPPSEELRNMIRDAAEGRNSLPITPNRARARGRHSVPASGPGRTGDTSTFAGRGRCAPSVPSSRFGNSCRSCLKGHRGRAGWAALSDQREAIPSDDILLPCEQLKSYGC